VWLLSQLSCEELRFWQSVLVLVGELLASFCVSQALNRAVEEHECFFFSLELKHSLTSERSVLNVLGFQFSEGIRLVDANVDA